MNRVSRLSLLVGVISLNATFVTRVQSGEPDSPRLLAAKSLDAALSQADDASDPGRRIELLRAAVQAAVRAVPQNSLIAESFQFMADATFSDSEKAAKKWKAELITARELLRFEPLLEAPVPDGFPEPTPAGEIRLQEYPAYRLAQTGMTVVEGQAFFTLFNHIKQQEIAMTAPVEITYSGDRGKQNKKSVMSFLYRNTQQGTLGTSGKVAVSDVPAQSAVSFGLRGDDTKESLTDARRRLEAWLQSHASEYEACGPLRVLGYNSPFVPEAKRFSEVQIPVRAKPRTEPVP
ncbi:MAG: hypothetical protein EXS05_16970 [Planctomycetaceae bacterium]|nr:hypothetical protein [Planctomycetaceae bacterium]